MTAAACGFTGVSHVRPSCALSLFAAVPAAQYCSYFVAVDVAPVLLSYRSSRSSNRQGRASHRQGKILEKSSARGEAAAPRVPCTHTPLHIAFSLFKIIIVELGDGGSPLALTQYGTFRPPSVLGSPQDTCGSPRIPPGSPPWIPPPGSSPGSARTHAFSTVRTPHALVNLFNFIG